MRSYSRAKRPVSCGDAIRRWRENSIDASQHSNVTRAVGITQSPKGDLAGTFRYRVGDHRVIYTVDDDVVRVFVIVIAKRADACK